MGWWEGRARKAEWDRVWEMGGCCFKARKGPEQGCLCQRAGPPVQLHLALRLTWLLQWTVYFLLFLPPPKVFAWYTSSRFHISPLAHPLWVNCTCKGFFAGYQTWRTLPFVVFGVWWRPLPLPGCTDLALKELPRAVVCVVRWRPRGTAWLVAEAASPAGASGRCSPCRVLAGRLSRGSTLGRGAPALPTQDGVQPRPRVTQQGSQGLDSRSLGLTLKSDCLFPLVVKEGQAESSGMGSRSGGGGPTGLGRFPLSLRRGA